MAQGELGRPEARAGVGDRQRPLQALQLSLNLALIAAWLWLYRPLAGYLSIIFTREDFRTNQILLGGILLLLALQLRGARRWPRPDAPPCPATWPLILLVGGTAGFLLVERFLDVNTLAAALFGLASYGLLGLWMEPARWRAGLPAALLVIGVLPFGTHLQTFVGYPLRIATAAIVQDGLQAAGVGSVGVDTILVFENGVSQIDLPCSGVQSLWTGMLFLLAATWVERRAINGRWLAVAAIFGVLLLAANLARVAVLVTTGPVLGWDLTAEMLHVPLGVLGFAAACAAAVLLLRRVGRPYPEQPQTTTDRRAAPAWFLPLLLALVLLASILYAKRAPDGLRVAAPAWQWPAALVTEPLPLKSDELAWLTRDGAESTVRQRFRYGDLSGTMILITSSTWRAHHRPERCFEVYGLQMQESRTLLAAPGRPVRFVALGEKGQTDMLPAVYWFQSTDHITDDYATRIWDDLAPQRARWVLVSILFDAPLAGEDPAVQQLVVEMQEAVSLVLDQAVESS